ncbi:MAG: hypothetical protein LAN63_00460 [Acidobacteriia bacterium]|nr:hypothetical protein [Terriglobia bacterium]
MKRVMLILGSVLLFGMSLWAQTGGPAATPSPAAPGASAAERSESRAMERRERRERRRHHRRRARRHHRRHGAA